MSIDNPPLLLDTTNIVPCFIFQITERTHERLRSWISSSIYEEAKAKHIKITGRRIKRMDKIVGALTKRIFLSISDMLESSPFIESPGEDGLQEILAEAVGGLWYSYFDEDISGEGTAFERDLKGQHKTLIIEL